MAAGRSVVYVSSADTKDTHMIAVFADALAAFTPEPDELVRRLSAGVDDAMLLDMASLDYGREIEANRAALHILREGGRLPAPMPFEPREVLELTRWFRPDDEPVEADRRRGHAMRAFACAALLRASGEPGNADLCEGLNQTLVNLLWSLDALDAGDERAGVGLLVWLMGQLAPENRTAGTFDFQFEDTAFLGLGVFWLGLRMRPRFSEAALIAVAEWISDSEQPGTRRHSTDYGLAPGRWLLGSTSYDLCHEEWRRLGRALLTEDISDLSPDAADWVCLIGSLLAD